MVDTPSLAALAASMTSERLNAECFCVGMDAEALQRWLAQRSGHEGLFELLQQRCPYVFAARPVFVSSERLAQMEAVVRAVEQVVRLPAYRERVLAHAPEIARRVPGGAQGVFFGYDFHATEAGVGLIEINTNAGGAMLNALLARAQRACCGSVQALLPPALLAERFEDQIVAMFRHEWALGGHSRPLGTIAIVGERPEGQYLYPEFLLFQRLFSRHGIEAVIADPGELQVRGGRLWHGELAIDLVYNRLTDFALESPSSTALREACLEGAAVVTPHPLAHALYADKRNLALLSDPAELSRLGVPRDVQAPLLAAIPRTEVVVPQNHERLWAERKRLFFKPFGGFGSRAAYRGDKLTQRVWQEILAGGYVAQALVAPGERLMSEEATAEAHKFDLRQYVYEGEVQWVAARLYRGQTTNFRTPGGGFAPVYPVPTLGVTGGTMPV